MLFWQRGQDIEGKPTAALASINIKKFRSCKSAPDLPATTVSINLYLIFVRKRYMGIVLSPLRWVTWHHSPILSYILIMSEVLDIRYEVNHPQVKYGWSSTLLWKCFLIFMVRLATLLMYSLHIFCYSLQEYLKAHAHNCKFASWVEGQAAWELNRILTKVVLECAAEVYMAMLML